MTWNPTQYQQYADVRLRPALELLARIALPEPRTVVDLGCGAGNVTRLLAERWPGAAIAGVDSSEEMLAKARAAKADLSQVSFHSADIGSWSPSSQVDLVYSNAALHWLPDHATLFPRIARAVAPRGVLAVQMPRNFAEPSHTSVVEVAQSARWRERLSGLVREAPVAAPSEYLHWLDPLCADLDVWETIYQQRLPAREDGEHPVVAFVSGAWLVPYFERFAGDGAARVEFLADYRERIERSYPRERDGGALFPVRRIFIVATRR